MTYHGGAPAGGGRADWETPPELFERLNRVFRFNLDVCAMPKNSKCKKFFAPISPHTLHMPSSHLDGLSQDWVIWKCPSCDYETYGNRDDGVDPLNFLPSSLPPYLCPACGSALGAYPAVVYMNPPYGRALAAWLEKARRESQQGATVVALLPNDQSTRWFHDHVKPFATIFPLDGRIRFVGAEGSPNFGSMIAIYWPKGFWDGSPHPRGPQ